MRLTILLESPVSLASHGMLAFAQVLSAPHGVECRSADLTGARNAELVPDLNLSIAAGCREAFTIGVYGDSPAHPRVCWPGRCQPPPGPCIGLSEKKRYKVV